MAKLSYLSASETRALLCKYFDKVRPQANAVGHLLCRLRARRRMLTGIIPPGGVPARGGTQAPAGLGRAGDAAGRAAEAGAVAGERPGSHTAGHGPPPHAAAEGAREERAAAAAAVSRCAPPSSRLICPCRSRDARSCPVAGRHAHFVFSAV